MNQNKYEETNIEFVGIPKMYYKKKHEHEEKSYQHLTNKLSMTNIEFFTLTVLIGKLVVKQRKIIEGGIEQFFKMTKQNVAKNEMVILKSIAVDEVNNPFILKDYIEMRKIWIEYSISGFEKLFEWYKQNMMYEKLSELIISEFE